MRKSFLFPMLAVFISVLTVVPAHALEVEVESVSLTRVGSSATYRWSAVLKNLGEKPADVSTITLDGRQGDEGSWRPASGIAVQLPPTGGRSTSGYISFVRAANTPKLKITAWKDGPLASKIIDMPPEPVPMFEISNCVVVDDSKFNVDVKNISSEGISDLTLQASRANYMTPDKWEPAGGMSVPELNPQATYTKICNRDPDSAIYRMQVFRGGAKVAEQVFDLRTPEQIQALAGPGQEEPQEAASATKKAAPVSRTVISTGKATIEGRGAIKKTVPIEKIRQY